MVAARSLGLLLPLLEPVDVSESRRSRADDLAPCVGPARESTVVCSSFSWADDCSSDGWSDGSSDDDDSSASVDSTGASIHCVADCASVRSGDSGSDCAEDAATLSALVPTRRRGNADPAAAAFTARILVTSIKMELGSWALSFPPMHTENAGPDVVAPIQVI